MRINQLFCKTFGRAESHEGHDFSGEQRRAEPVWAATSVESIDSGLPSK